MIVRLTDQAVRDLSKLDRHISGQILDFIERRIQTLEDPRSQGKALSGAWRGYWRYRSGDYRLICDIQDDEFLIIVIKVGHRSDVYD